MKINFEGIADPVESKNVHMVTHNPGYVGTNLEVYIGKFKGNIRYRTLKTPEPYNEVCRKLNRDEKSHRF